VLPARQHTARPRAGSRLARGPSFPVSNTHIRMNQPPRSAAAFTEPQRIAGSFTQAGLLPKRFSLREVPVWS